MIKKATPAIHNICSKNPEVNIVQLSVPPVPKFLAAEPCSGHDDSIPLHYRQFKREGRAVYRLNEAMKDLAKQVNNFMFLEFESLYFETNNHLDMSKFAPDNYHISELCASSMATQLIDHYKENY